MLNYLFSLVIIISLAIRCQPTTLTFHFSSFNGHYCPHRLVIILPPPFVLATLQHTILIFYIMPRSENLCDKLTYWGFSLPGSHVLVLKYSLKSIKRFKCYGPVQRPYYKKANKGTKVLHAAQKENQRMLNIDLDDHASVNVTSYEYRINCDTCDQEALIFQVEGNFCLNCWQDRTEPNIA